MGQQQLLLLVLGIVLVGIAITLGITAYSTGSSKANADALFQDALNIASQAQAWKRRPELFAGSPDATKNVDADFSELTFYQLGYSGSEITEGGECLENQNGNFALFAEEDFLGILGSNVNNQNQVGVVVMGTTAGTVGLFDATWNPIIGGTGADGSDLNVKRHKRCRGNGSVPMHAGTK